MKADAHLESNSPVASVRGRISLGIRLIALVAIARNALVSERTTFGTDVPETLLTIITNLTSFGTEVATTLLLIRTDLTTFGTDVAVAFRIFVGNLETDVEFELVQLNV